MSENIQVKILEVSGIETAFAYVGLPHGEILNPISARGNTPRRLLTKLISQGDDHAKIMRQVTVHMEITAPRYWWTQFATYEIGREMYSGSTMHTLMKGVSSEDFVHGVQEDTLDMVDYFVNESPDLRYAKINLPEGYLQTRLVMVSYQTLRRIWLQRRRHRLMEWHEFIEALHELPYCHDLIFVEPKNPWRELWVEWFDFSGEPWERDDRGQWHLCFFCGSRDSHSPDCVYPKAKRLLDNEAKSQPDPWHRLCQFWKTALTSLETYGGENESNPKESTK